MRQMSLFHFKNQLGGNNLTKIGEKHMCTRKIKSSLKIMLSYFRVERANKQRANIYFMYGSFRYQT